MCIESKCVYNIYSNRSWALILCLFAFLHRGGVDMCLNEYHMFMLLAGAFMGYAHSLMGVVQNIHYVSFRIIQVCVLGLIAHLHFTPVFVTWFIRRKKRL